MEWKSLYHHQKYDREGDNAPSGDYVLVSEAEENVQDAYERGFKEGQWNILELQWSQE